MKYAVMRNKHVSISSLSNITCSLPFFSVPLSIYRTFVRATFFGLAIKLEVIEKTKMKRSNKRNVMKLNKFGAYVSIISIQYSVNRRSLVTNTHTSPHIEREFERGQMIETNSNPSYFLRQAIHNLHQ